MPNSTIFQLLIGITSLPLKLLSSIIPKDKTLWVVANDLGFNDNAMAFANYLHTHHPEIKLVWLTKTCRPSSDIPFTVIKRNSARGLLIQTRAKVFLLSTGLSEAGLARPLFGTLIIQLWHGWPIKKILLDEARYQTRTRWDIKARLQRIFLGLSLKQYSLVICHNAELKELFRNCFSLNDSYLCVTGWPRLDERSKNTTIKEESKILVLPTWHQNSDALKRSLAPVLSNEFKHYCKQRNITPLIKLHPLHANQGRTLKKQHEWIQFAAEDTPNEHLISRAKFVITDFSSIAIDAEVIYQCRIILLAGELERYEESRGIYASYLSTYEQYGVNSPRQLIKELELANQPVKKFNIKPAKDTCEKIYRAVVEKLQ